jgi:hypothetical protein
MVWLYEDMKEATAEYRALGTLDRDWVES